MHLAGRPNTVIATAYSHKTTFINKTCLMAKPKTKSRSSLLLALSLLLISSSIRVAGKVQADAQFAAKVAQQPPQPQPQISDYESNNQNQESDTGQRDKETLTMNNEQGEQIKESNTEIKRKEAQRSRNDEKANADSVSQHKDSVTSSSAELDSHRLASEPAQVQAIPQQAHRSCYVCTTMDYENPANNYCRFMKRMIQQQHQQHSSSSNYDASQLNALRQRTHAHNNQDATLQISPPADSSTQVLGPANSTSSDHLLYSNNNNDSTDGAGSTTNKSTKYIDSNGMSPIDSGSLQYGAIRTRYCYSDENFCSVVSVVRIEYINNELQSRFWALERNCSKSCNTGCMLIGEIVRLRVCSICCRKSNCNVGGGSTSTHLPSNTELILLTLMISLIIYGHSWSKQQMWLETKMAPFALC